MSEYLIQEETLTGIADAIRGKTGGTDPVAVSDMAAQIEGIQAGGGDIDAFIDGSIGGEVNRNVVSVKGNAFSSCNNLISVNLPKAKTIGTNAFSNCDNLTEVHAPATTNIESGAFQNSRKITTANFPLVEYINSNTFHSCSGLVSVNLPNARTIAGYAFYSCTSLRILDLPSLSKITANYAFANCSVLEALVLRKEAVCTLANQKTFTGTPIASGTGYIYTPSALIDQYKAATNWSIYAAQFRTLEDYTVDGTVTGELDESKI